MCSEPWSPARRLRDLEFYAVLAAAAEAIQLAASNRGMAINAAEGHGNKRRRGAVLPLRCVRVMRHRCRAPVMYKSKHR